MCSTDPALGSKVRWTEKFVIARRVRSRDLRWCAAESAGERRCDVGRSDNLLGRFFGWHLLFGGWVAARGGFIERPLSTISLICESSSVSYSSMVLAITAT